ncbi:MAG: hypothetical protein ACETVZ_03115 [Phycisphaerae bacterium]
MKRISLLILVVLCVTITLSIRQSIYAGSCDWGSRTLYQDCEGTDMCWYVPADERYEKEVYGGGGICECLEGFGSYAYCGYWEHGICWAMYDCGNDKTCSQCDETPIDSQPNVTCVLK